MGIGVEKILVQGSAADQGQTAGGCMAKSDGSFQIRIVWILYAVDGVNLDQAAEPFGQPLKNGGILIGVGSPADWVGADGIAAGFIERDKICRFLRGGIQRALHLIAPSLVKGQAVIVDLDIVKVSQFFPGSVDVVRLVVGLSSQLPVRGVLKEDIVPRDHRIDQDEHDEHDDQHGNHGPEEALQDVPLFHV